MKRIILLTLLLLIIFGVEAQTTATYRNPVIPGDCPDPTVIRVGNTYYAAGTSSEWAPPYRLYRSSDLVNWEYLGSLFKEMPEWTIGSYWAPELFYRNGTYFVYYTARRKSDRKSFIGVATTRDITQGFKDQGILIEWTNEAIDAFVIELDGKLYVTWKAYGLDKGKKIEILGSELSSDGLKLKGEHFSMLQAESGWEAGGMEGQCLVKRGDYIYMFYAGNSCCGVHCDYMTGVARARSIRGPWEKYSGNPILHSDTQWRCPGHGTLVETPEHRYFYMYHAYNAATNVYTGRQGMLDEIVWDSATSWPAFRYGKTPSVQASAPYPNTVQLLVPDFIDEFDNAALNKEWIWEAAQPKPQITLSQNKLFLTGNTNPSGALLGLRPRKENYVLSATVEPSDASTGICIYGNREHVLGLSLENGNLVLWEVRSGSRSVMTEQKIEAGRITLSVEVKFGQYVRFGYSLDDGKQKTFGDLISLKNLPQWDRPPMIGIQARGENQRAIFDAVKLKYEM